MEHFSATCAQCHKPVVDMREEFNFADGPTVYAKCHGDVQWLTVKEFRDSQQILFENGSYTKKEFIRLFKERFVA